MRLTALALAAAALLGLSGCVAYDVASTAVGAAGTVVGTTVDVAGGVVSTVTGGSDDAKK
jgi:hypothetical protein